MANLPKKAERVDLQKIAAQLGSVKLTPVAEGDHISLRAVARFTTRSFDAGKYKVSVGLNQALLHLDHPSFELENAYQATLPKNIWSENSTDASSSRSGAGGEAKGNFKLFRVLRLSGRFQGETDHHKKAEQKSSAPYRIVTAVPSGWQIGSELGDPRTPHGALPEGLEHCLNGEYLSARGQEEGDGVKDKYGVLALCTLKSNGTGNDPRIIATLFGVSGALRISIAVSEDTEKSANILAQDRDKREHEDILRKAFVEICLQRAETARKQGAPTDAAVTGDFYLSHYEIHAPKLSESSLFAERADKKTRQ